MRWFGFSQGKIWAHKAVKVAVYLQSDFKGALLLQKRNIANLIIHWKLGYSFCQPIKSSCHNFILKNIFPGNFNPKKSQISYLKSKKGLHTHPPTLTPTHKLGDMNIYYQVIYYNMQEKQVNRLINFENKTGKKTNPDSITVAQSIFRGCILQKENFLTKHKDTLWKGCFLGKTRV